MADNVAEIAGRLSEAQRNVGFYGVGYKKLPARVIELADMGLVNAYPAMAGWSWRPTETGLAVRAYLENSRATD